MNAELIQRALERVGNVNTLINMVSRRVRQLTAGSGGISRPLVADTTNLGMADIALREIIEGKIGWEEPEMPELTRPVNRKRGRTGAGGKALRATSPRVVKDIAA